MRKVFLTACSAVAVLAGATPASAAASQGEGQALRGCAAQAEHAGELRSPTCQPDGSFHPPAGGIESNHNETLMRDAP
jgi:hypothetical protein